MDNLTSDKKIRVLIVDDSAFMRKAISMMLEEDPEIQVVGTARNGEEGVEKVFELKPDLVTMDIEMPRLDGLAALKKIMDTNPVPVMMLSSLTTEGASATLDALELGAVDFIPKQLSFVSLDIVKIKEELLMKIKDIARRKSTLMMQFRRNKFIKIRDNHESGQPISTSISYSAPKRNHPIGLIAIGSSTGGPPALQQVIPKLPRNLPVGILVAQHMPAQFTKSMADRLNSVSQLTVLEAQGGEEIAPGTVFIAPGGRHISVRKSGNKSYTVVSDRPAESLYKPCVNILMESMANSYGKMGMGVILTGMGNDGLEGMKVLKQQGGIIIAQNEDSCVVYGMPKAVVEAKISDHIAPIENISNEIISYF